MTVKVYSTLDKSSDIFAYKDSSITAYSMIVSYFDAEGVMHDLKYAGTSVYAPDLKSFRDKLFELRKIGYIVNDSAFEMIDEELNNGA